MKTYNQFLNTPFSEEVKPPEPPSEEEDPSIKSKEKRQKQIKKMVLLKKLQAVRAGAGADIVAGYEPEGEVLDELKTSTLRNYVNKASIDAVGRGVDAGIKGMTGPKKEMEKNMTKAYKRQRGINRAADKLASRAERNEEVELDERLGGKGYSRKAAASSVYPGKKGTGDWEDSDRGKGNKAKRRAGEEVEKKSPTYLAHVLNKKKKVSEGTDKAFDFVKAKIEKEVGKSGYVSKDNPRKPQSAADKAKVRAHQAKIDKENAAARAKDPSQGRYPKG